MISFSMITITEQKKHYTKKELINMNQMYLNDIDLMKFEHVIRSDLDMFMIECYEDYYCEAEGAKEGIFTKIKKK